MTQLALCTTLPCLHHNNNNDMPKPVHPTADNEKMYRKRDVKKTRAANKPNQTFVFSAIVNTCKCLKSIKWKFWFNSTIVGRIRVLPHDFAPLPHHKAMIENVIQNFRCGSRHDPFGHISVVDMISFATFFQQHLRNYNFCDGISAFVFLLGNFAVQFISSRNSQPQVDRKKTK